MREHEHRCFAARTELPAESIVCHDLCAASPTLAQVRRHDVLMIGGSGDFYVSKRNLPHFEALLELLRQVADMGHPTFMSCFGFGCVVVALGGEMVYDEASAEVGTYEVLLNDDGRSDPLFGELPPRFNAQMGHKDKAVRVPPGLTNLATSERCRYHVLRVVDKPIWATQFHPELDREANLDRFRRYLADYGPDDPEKCAAAMEGFKVSAEASTILRRFLDFVCE
jgi:GMP synthase (glutamine-hydrolysing)